MIVFFYDKTFDGLLTAVFDAYQQKIFPDKLVEINGVAPLFTTEQYTVSTQDDKAKRVWAALQNKLSKYTINMLTHIWLSEQDGSDELIFRYIRKTFDNKVSIENNFGDEDVLMAQQLAKKVAREGQFLREFIRFQKAADGIFFAPVSPIYNALPLVIEHLTDRFSDQRWVVYDLKRKYGYYYDLDKATEITLDNNDHLLDGKLDESLMANDEKLFQELWKGYFKSMTIKERINPKLQRQHMPKRFWKYLTEKQ